MVSIKIGFSYGDSLVSKIIVACGKRQTGDAKYSHAFLVIDDNIVIEETFHGLRASHIDKYKDVKHELWEVVDIPISRKERIKIDGLSHLGTLEGIYGYAKLPLFLLDAAFKTYWFTQHIGIKNFKVCSQWIAYLLYKFGGLDEFKDWRIFSPDLLLDTIEKLGIFHKCYVKE